MRRTRMRWSAWAVGGAATVWCGIAAFAAAPKAPAKAKPAAAKATPAAAKAPVAERPAMSPQDMEFFEREVRPVLAQECYS